MNKKSMITTVVCFLLTVLLTCIHIRIPVMETVGYLEPAEQAHLTAELETAGLTEIDYEGSTLEPAGYGERIILQIHGKLGGHYEIREKRVSTAKN